jgi:hypothetical protein
MCNMYRFDQNLVAKIHFQNFIGLITLMGNQKLLNLLQSIES